MIKRHLLCEMTSEEAGKALKEADFVVLPTGSVEQHSKHLPLGTDSIRVTHYSAYLAEHPDGLKFVVLPTLYYGLSEHHIHFPGTITLKLETYIDLISDIAWSLKQHGVKRLLIINGHGGNGSALGLARLRIEREIGLETYFLGQPTSFSGDLLREFAGEEIYGHSGLWETSEMLHFRPDLVRKDKIKKQEMARPGLRGSGSIWDEERKTVRAITRQAPYYEQNWIDGGIGDPGIATAEFGRKLKEESTKRTVKALKEDMKWYTEPT